MEEKRMEKNEYLITFASRNTASKISSYVTLASDVHDLDYLKYYSYKAVIDNNNFSMVEWKIISIINREGDEVLEKEK